MKKFIYYPKKILRNTYKQKMQLHAYRTKASYKGHMHKGSVQIGLKPLTRGSLDVVVLLCLRDIRRNRFHVSLLGTVDFSHGVMTNLF
jgi:hypothetical protein